MKKPEKKFGDSIEKFTQEVSSTTSKETSEFKLQQKIRFISI